MADTVSDIGDRVSEFGGAIGSKISDIGGNFKTFLSSKFQSDTKEENVMDETSAEAVNVDDEPVIVETGEAAVKESNEEVVSVNGSSEEKVMPTETL